MTDTDCRKCKAPMPPPTPIRGFFSGVQFSVTAYRCQCGHWNDLKKRKPRKQKESQ